MQISSLAVVERLKRLWVKREKQAVDLIAKESGELHHPNHKNRRYDLGTTDCTIGESFDSFARMKYLHNLMLSFSFWWLTSTKVPRC